MKVIGTIIIIGALVNTPAAPRSADPYASPQSEVLAVIKTLTDGWREADSKKVESVLHPNFRLVTLRESPVETQTDTREHLLETIERIKPGAWDDRLRAEEVRIDPSGIATVWAKYEFYINGKRSHCGIESFQLYHLPDGWKIINFADTHSDRFCKE